MNTNEFHFFNDIGDHLKLPKGTVGQWVKRGCFAVGRKTTLAHVKKFMRQLEAKSAAAPSEQ